MKKHQLTGYALPDGVKMKSIARTRGYWNEGKVHSIDCMPSERKIRICASEDGKERGVSVFVEIEFSALAYLLQFALEAAASEAKSSGV